MSTSLKSALILAFILFAFALSASYVLFASHAHAAISNGCVVPWSTNSSITGAKTSVDLAAGCDVSCTHYGTDVAGSQVACETDQSIGYTVDWTQVYGCQVYYGPGNPACDPSNYQVPYAYVSACYASTGSVTSGAWSQTATTCPYSPPINITSFAASPNPVSNGGTTILSWNASGAASCTSGDFNTNGAPSGSVSVTVNTGSQTSKTYSITCVDASATRSKSANVTVNVSNPNVPGACTAWDADKAVTLPNDPAWMVPIGTNGGDVQSCINSCKSISEGIGGSVTCGLKYNYSLIGNHQSNTSGGGSESTYYTCGYKTGSNQTTTGYGTDYVQFLTPGSIESRYTYTPTTGWLLVPGYWTIQAAWDYASYSGTGEFWVFQNREQTLGAITCTSAPTGNPNLVAAASSNVSGSTGSSVVLTSTFSNSGTNTTNASFPVTIFIKSGGAPYTNFTSTRAALGAGASDAFTYGFNLPAGTYTYYTCADQNASGTGAITESNENDNCGGQGTITVVPSTPTGLNYSCNANGNAVTLSWNAVSGGSPYNPRIVVANASECPAGWQIWTDGVTCFPNPDAWSSTSVTNFPVVPGRTYNWWVHSAGNATPGYGSFTCNGIADLTAGNTSSTVYNPGAGSWPAAGVPAPFNGTVANIGTKTANSVPNIFQYTKDSITYYTASAGITSLSPNETSGVSANITFPSSGDWSIRTCSDYTPAYATTVAESDENNNCGAWLALRVTPAAPTGLTASCNANGTLATLSWNSSPGASFYYARFNPSNSGSCPVNWQPVPGDPATCIPNPDNVSGTSVVLGTIPGRAYTSWVHSALGTGEWSSPSYASFTCSGSADVSGGNVTPTSAPAGSVTLSAQGTNLSTATGPSASFPMLFQIANNVANPTASDIIAQLNSAYGPALAPNTSATFTAARTFTAGTYKVRSCANLNTSGVAIVSESDFGNNCGTWSTLTVTNPTPTCNLTADAPIAPTTLRWSSTNATSCTGGGFSTGGAASGNVPISDTTGGTYTLSCSGPGGFCSASQSLTGTTCAGPAVVDIKANGSDGPVRVQTGTPVTITWSASNVPGATPSCTISGPGVSQTIPTSGIPTCALPAGGTATPTVTTQSTYTITCGATTDTVLVNVIPAFQNF